MRTEKELWELVLSRPDLFDKCLCFWIIELKYADAISIGEFMVLDDILLSEMNRIGRGYFIGPPYDIKPRIDWIKKRIESL